MAGRDPLPGEPDPHEGTRDGDRYHSRLVRGQISSVNPDDGVATVDTIDVIGTREVTVPPLWFSATGRTSAWGRYMPMGDENVDVSYRNDDSAVITNYDMTATQDGRPGWNVLREFEEAGNVVGFANFRKLKRGEYDFKSSGDAYIHGSNQGTLTLAGGQAFMKLDKQQYRIESRAAEFHQTSETSETRFGTVFRKNVSTDLAETQINSGAFKEFLVDVNASLPSGTASPQSRAKLHFGDILDGTNAAENSQFGSPLRGRISIGDSSDLFEVFKLEIDQDGNVAWAQVPTSPGGALTTEIKVSDTTITINGAAGEFFMNLANTVDVKVAISDHLETLWMDLVNWVIAHTHGTGVGPSSPPVEAANFPQFDINIKSNRFMIPDN